MNNESARAKSPCVPPRLPKVATIHGYFAAELSTVANRASHSLRFYLSWIPDSVFGNPGPSEPNPLPDLERVVIRRLILFMGR